MESEGFVERDVHLGLLFTTDSLDLVFIRQVDRRGFRAAGNTEPISEADIAGGSADGSKRVIRRDEQPAHFRLTGQGFDEEGARSGPSGSRRRRLGTLQCRIERSCIELQDSLPGTVEFDS